MSTSLTITKEDDTLHRRIQELGNEVAGACVIVTRGRLVSGTISSIPYFIKEDEALDTLGFDSETCQFYLVESGLRIASVYDIVREGNMLYVSGWPTGKEVEENWREIRWVITF